ncbi:cation diffusion facilitator family transporter [Candidatus Pandoraea novymonadis]|uniref:Cation efflux system protein n=1 Tax=Candidatus Pandoraea novymonadis TaxID=1808959 RepID=A0ABX5FD02_9BURK|nr:cation diffusion facilitator family transporter [Candidatus Pandoraea novymonadis]PSB91671.1 putative cation efflux system protein [Candidatus Pandoraea novymonadis]
MSRIPNEERLFTPSGHSLPHTAKQRVARRTTWISIWVNIILTCAQMTIGIMARSQALIADGIHSVSDIVSDVVVLAATRGCERGPDEDHPYGHSRYENAAGLFLGTLLLVVGAGMLWRGIDRLLHPEDITSVYISALIVAGIVLLTKEALFRYMLHEAQRVRSAMLVANAWHARSDAASSLVVAIGILGNLAGYHLLDPAAAALVGLMIGHTGWKFGWNSLQDLIDRRADEAVTARIRQELLATPGVQGLDKLRTRKMGDQALVDVHLLVDPHISVSEGHYIAEKARAAAMTDPQVLDVLVHIDPESDATGTAQKTWPSRERLTEVTQALCTNHGVTLLALTPHYLDNAMEVDLTFGQASKLPDDQAIIAREAVTKALGATFNIQRVRPLLALDESNSTS